jgi:hypothetical protein
MDSRHDLERHTRRWVACAISLNVWLAGRVSLAIAAAGVAARRATWPSDVPGHRCDPNPAAIYQEGHGDARRGTGATPCRAAQIVALASHPDLDLARRRGGAGVRRPLGGRRLAGHARIVAGSGARSGQPYALPEGGHHTQTASPQRGTPGERTLGQVSGHAVDAELIHVAQPRTMTADASPF